MEKDCTSSGSRKKVGSANESERGTSETSYVPCFYTIWMVTFHPRRKCLLPSRNRQQRIGYVVG
jgi:hypothetical protein